MGKTLLGILLLLIGAGVVLGDFGGLIAFMIVAGLLYYGAKKWKRSETQGQKAFALTVLGFALVLLLSFLPTMLGFLIGGAILYYGWKMFKGNRVTPDWNLEPAVEVKEGTTVSMDTSFEAEWNEFLNKQKQND